MSNQLSFRSISRHEPGRGPQVHWQRSSETKGTSTLRDPQSSGSFSFPSFRREQQSLTWFSKIALLCVQRREGCAGRMHALLAIGQPGAGMSEHGFQVQELYGWIWFPIALIATLDHDEPIVGSARHKTWNGHRELKVAKHSIGQCK
jgi:hypothetical protein